MPIQEPRVTAYCDWCEEVSDEMDLTSLAGGGWDDRNINRKLERAGWIVAGSETFCCAECAKKQSDRAIAAANS